MHKTESYKKWLETAYLIFAEEGPEKLTIKSLANHCGLPRTNFYYYFFDKDDLIDKVIEFHYYTTANLFNEDLRNRCNILIPDLYDILLDYKIGLQFAKMLFKNREIQKYNIAYKHGVSLTADIIVPKFKEYFNINLPHSEAKALWFTLTDAWYSRLDFNNFSSEYLSNLALEILETLLPLINQLKAKEKFFI